MLHFCDRKIKQTFNGRRTQARFFAKTALGSVFYSMSMLNFIWTTFYLLVIIKTTNESLNFLFFFFLKIKIMNLPRLTPNLNTLTCYVKCSILLYDANEMQLFCFRIRSLSFSLFQFSFLLFNLF